jgi:replicative DNA helicase
MDTGKAKVPPHSKDTEIAVLGAMMISSNAMHRAEGLLTEEIFYFPAHKEIFKAISALSAENKPVDLITLSDEMTRRDTLSDIGGLAYLAEINSETPSAGNIEQHCYILIEKHIKRKMIDIGSDIIEGAFDDTKDALEDVDKAQGVIFQLSENIFKKSYQSIKDLSITTYQDIQEAIQNKGKIEKGVGSGLTELDKLTGGFQNSDLIIIAARPSMGKTALALTFVKNAAIKYGKSVAFFSLEMAAVQIGKRLISSQAYIPLQNLRTGDIDTAGQQRLVDATATIANCAIFVDDPVVLTINELRAKCRRMVNEHDIDMVIIDYLQLMHVPNAESREREISIISQTLKQIAKEIDKPVISLAQLNRSVEGRSSKTPMLSDLRESGSIEQDADLVMFVNRPEYYNKERYEDGTPTAGTAELIIAKQRNGPVGTVRCAFRNEYALFEDLEQYDERPPVLNNRNEEEPF